eukprot:564177-Hanusia_phi.AAC.1
MEDNPVVAVRRAGSRVRYDTEGLGKATVHCGTAASGARRGAMGVAAAIARGDPRCCRPSESGHAGSQ